MAGLFGRVGAALSPAARVRHALEEAKAGRAAEVFPTLAKAAERGDGEAPFRVGKAYLDGTRVPPSRTTAAVWLERAAQPGLREAQSVLAALYLTGAGKGSAEGAGHGLFTDAAGMEPDFDKAVRWAKAAAEAGSAESQALLGYVLTSGPEHLRDLAAADEWYRKSAEAGCPQGSLGHGLALMRKASTDEEKQKGAVQIALAAAANLPLGLYLLGMLTEGGLGMQADPTAAAQLYR